ncbi:Gram-positive signal peptide protein, YSIRK family [Streptococcus pyogenes GA40884]|nr:Gram-positive signal peptide protein, YSIRK family [Streptococcus pyogenes GA40884]
MARKDTNKQYSLRKLKTGTASVAVAVAVLGAGFANQTEVKADSSREVTNELTASMWKAQADSAKAKAKELEKQVEEYKKIMKHWKKDMMI